MMRNGRFTRGSFLLALHAAILLPASLIPHSVHAQDSFVAAGPLSFYTDYATGVYSDHQFSATVYYDATVPPSISNSSMGSFEEAFFMEAVVRIEYTIFDGEGFPVAEIVDDGMTPAGKSSFIYGRNDLSGTGDDELEYNTNSESNSHFGQAVIRLNESAGTLVGDLTVVPPPPAPGGFESALVRFDYFEFDGDGIPTMGLGAQGTITSIIGGETDPFEDCAATAKNHGQYVSCIAHELNKQKAAGDMTGKEKGQQQKEAARKK